MRQIFRLDKCYDICIFGEKHSVMRSFGIEMLAPPVARKRQEPRPVRNKWLAHFIRLSNPTSRFLGTPTGRNTNRPIDQQTHQQVRTEEHLHPNTAFMQLYYRSYHRWYQEMHERANCNLIENNIVQTYFKAFLIPARIAKSKVARV